MAAGPAFFHIVLEIEPVDLFPGVSHYKPIRCVGVEFDGAGAILAITAWTRKADEPGFARVASKAACAVFRAGKLSRMRRFPAQPLRDTGDDTAERGLATK